jgi:hypothetical protein
LFVILAAVEIAYDLMLDLSCIKSVEREGKFTAIADSQNDQRRMEENIKHHEVHSENSYHAG